VGTSAYSCYFLKSIDDVILIYASDENQNFIMSVNGTVPPGEVAIGDRRSR
jgi:hypothetical protein